MPDLELEISRQFRRRVLGTLIISRHACDVSEKSSQNQGCGYKERRLPKPSPCDVSKIFRLRIMFRAFQLRRDPAEENFWNRWRARCRECRAGDGRDRVETRPRCGVCVRANESPQDA